MDSRMVRNLDVRVRERNLKAGRLTAADVKVYLDGLVDVSDKAEALALRQPGFVFPDDEVASQTEAQAMLSRDREEAGASYDADGRGFAREDADN